jgi:DNA-binding NtrC family response regulator
MGREHSKSPNAVACPAAVAPPVAGTKPRRLLIVDDNELTCKQLKEILKSNPALQVDTLSDAARAIEELTQVNHSIVITDLRMPKLDGMELLRQIGKKRLPVTVIVTTGHGSIDEAVEAIRLGAYDFLTKPVDPEHLRLVIDRALRERALQDEVSALREQLETQYAFQNIISKNPHMHAVFELINNVAHTNTTVLIEGETGTGKEQVARAVHASSQGRDGPFVAINCAALPETLLESELFGHEKGSFTSAVGQRRGRFELANGGTIFFDEIGDVPASMQAKLLRVLQERSFERVGGSEPISVDVRVVAATNRPLQKMVKDGKFREDLYYRLNVVRIELPPLRDRPEDIPLLATHFIDKYAQPGMPTKQISPQAMEALLNYSWPGNIRELENAIERASVTSHNGVINVENLPPDLLTPRKSDATFDVDLSKPLTDVIKDTIALIERKYIRKALKKTRGHVGQCARICGMSRRSITSKIAEYKLDKAMFKND